VIKGIALNVLERTGLTLRVFRIRELIRRFDVSAMRRNRAYSSGTGPDGLPLPPPRLMTLVAGTPDVSWFLQSGKASADSCRSILARNGLDINEFESILDFGCGCGRIVRHWKDLENVDIHGTDYNPDLIEWCRESLPFASFSVNGLEPPLEYPDDTFDLVYALSVFTHLPKELQYRWIAELRRVLRPGGHLLITTHGDWHASYLTDEERNAFQSGEMIVRHGNVAGSNLCSAFHPREYLEHQLLVDFELLEHKSATKNEAGGVMQDMTLARLPIQSPV
jgi:SAM-dependent methyltransferase